MSRKDLDELKQYFRDIYPHIWEHYKFLYERRTDVNRKFEFLLAFESLFLLSYISLFGKFVLTGKIIFIVPLAFFLISIFISLYNLIPIKIWFPWFEKKNIKDVWSNKKEKEFYEEGLKSIYGVLRHLWEYDVHKSKLFLDNVLAIYASIIVSFGAILIYLNLSILLLLFIPISILTWDLIRKNWSKELVKKSPAPETEKFFDDWKKEIIERNKVEEKIK